MGSTAAEREEFLSSLQLKSGLFLSCRVYTHSTAECSLTHNGMRYVFDKSAFSHSLTSAEEKNQRDVQLSCHFSFCCFHYLNDLIEELYESKLWASLLPRYM